jgi:hypothetical protein
MKRMLMTLIALSVLVAAAMAGGRDSVSLRTGQQKRVGHGEIYVKFISVEEDSRCPENARCVWAGNAKIKVKIGFPGGTSKTVFMNTETGPKGDQIGGWAVRLESLTPMPRNGRKTPQSRYMATFTVNRLTR